MIELEEFSVSESSIIARGYRGCFDVYHRIGGDSQLNETIRSAYLGTPNNDFRYIQALIKSIGVQDVRTEIKSMKSGVGYSTINVDDDIVIDNVPGDVSVPFTIMAGGSVYIDDDIITKRNELIEDKKKLNYPFWGALFASLRKKRLKEPHLLKMLGFHEIGVPEITKYPEIDRNGYEDVSRVRDEMLIQIVASGNIIPTINAFFSGEKNYIISGSIDELTIQKHNDTKGGPISNEWEVIETICKEKGLDVLGVVPYADCICGSIETKSLNDKSKGPNIFSNAFKDKKDVMLLKGVESYVDIGGKMYEVGMPYFFRTLDLSDNMKLQITNTNDLYRPIGEDGNRWDIPTVG
jgi:hypothetical protein